MYQNSPIRQYIHYLQPPSFDERRLAVWLSFTTQQRNHEYPVRKKPSLDNTFCALSPQIDDRLLVVVEEFQVWFILSKQLPLLQPCHLGAHDMTLATNACYLSTDCRSDLHPHISKTNLRRVE